MIAKTVQFYLNIEERRHIAEAATKAGKPVGLFAKQATLALADIAEAATKAGKPVGLFAKQATLALADKTLGRPVPDKATNTIRLSSLSEEQRQEIMAIINAGSGGAT